MDLERRKAWNELRAGGDAEAARRFKGARWSLLKNPFDQLKNVVRIATCPAA